MLEFQDLRRVQAETKTIPLVGISRPGSPPTSWASPCTNRPALSSAVLADARRISRSDAQHLGAFGRGEIDGYRISLIASAVAKLTDNYQRIDLDDGVGFYAASHTTAQLEGQAPSLRRSLRDGRGSGEVRARQALGLGRSPGRRHVVPACLHPDCRRHPHRRRADQAGESHVRRPHPRSAQSRPARAADAWQRRRPVDQLTRGHRSRRPGTTLAGVSDEPGTSFDGSFALPADLVRDLAAEPGTLFYRIIKDPLGRILDIAELGRFPSEKLKIGLEIRDGTCVFPTCDAGDGVGQRSRDPASTWTDLSFEPPGPVPPAPQHQDPPDRRAHPLRDAPPPPSPRARPGDFVINLEYAA